MADAIAVLNAGSSSIKFSLFVLRGQELELALRGQVGGPLHRAALRGQGRRRQAAGTKRPGAKAASWGMPARSTTWSPTCARTWAATASPRIGHRVVHGGHGLHAAGAHGRRSPAGAARVRAARAAAPAAQPGPDPRCCCSALPELPQVACFDTAFHRTQPGAGADVRAAGEVPRAKACGATASTACPTSTSPRCCRPCDAARGRRAHRGAAPGQRREHVRAAGGAQRRQHHGLHRGGRAADGHALRRDRPGRDPVPDGPARHGRARHREADLQPVGPAGRLRHLERHAHAAGQRRRRAPAPRSTCTSTASGASWARWPPRWAAWTRSCSPAASASTRRRSASASAATREWLGLRARHAAPMRGRQPHQRRGQPRRRLGDAHQRGADDRPPHAGARLPEGLAMKTTTVEEAVARIPDGASLMIGGFMGVGTPELIDRRAGAAGQARPHGDRQRHRDARRGHRQARRRGPRRARRSRATSASIPRRRSR